MIIYNSLYRTTKSGSLVVMPAPVDKDTPHALWEAARCRNMAQTLAGYGCGAWLWPPLTMSQGGSADNADGYGKQYDLNVGQWPDWPMRWGTAEDILAANAVLHQHGMLVLEDAVIHQYDGGDDQNYVEIGSNGKPDASLFPKYPACFVPKVAVDDVFDSDGNAAFGDLVSYQHSTPPGYMLGHVIRALKWRKKRFALDGFRLDDTKGENVGVTTNIINSVGGWVFGECFTGNASELESWVDQSGGKRTLDFTLHWTLQAVCDSGASLRTLEGGGLCAWDPDHSVLFVDTADTDQNNNENIKFNKLWAYLYILTVPAAGALIYAGDYELYGLDAPIRQMMWASAMFAFGNISWRYVDDGFLVWSRSGDGGSIGWSGGLLCGFSTDPVNARGEWVQTPFQPNSRIHDYLGHGDDLWTNEFGWVYLTIGPNRFGSAQNGVAYAPAGVSSAPRVAAIAHGPVGSFTNFGDF